MNEKDIFDKIQEQAAEVEVVHHEVKLKLILEKMKALELKAEGGKIKNQEKFEDLILEAYKLGATNEDIVGILDKEKAKLIKERDFFTERAKACKAQSTAIGMPLRIFDSFEKMKDEPIGIALDNLESRFPTIFNKAYPRRFQLPQCYQSPKLFSTAVFWSFWAQARPTEEWLANSSDDFREACKRQQRQTDQASTTLFMTCCALIEKQVPTYFVSKAILQALLNTDLPKDFSLKDMPWPLDAMLFALPEGILEGPDGDIKLLAVVKLNKGQHYSNMGISWDNQVLDSWLENADLVNADSDRVSVVALNGQGKIYGWHKPIDDTDINEAVEPLGGVFDLTNLRHKSGAQTESNEEEEFVFKNLQKAAFQIILAMLACPEMIEGGVIERPEKKKKGKTQHALWAPNFFGKAYRRYEVVGKNDEPSHSKRTHWRRGYFRHQRFGPGSKGIKIIWIKPCMVNKDKLQET
jgi:hypothetical protein